MENKYESIYRILLAFMMIDNHVDEKEKKIINDFLNTRYGREMNKEAININYHLGKMGIENFKKDAKNIYNNFSREETFEILDFMSNMIKSDGKLNNHEIDLFEILLREWKIEQVIAEMLGIKKTLWARFYGESKVNN
ncbi:TerB family tellurite resistance protein [Candidatus Gracilibacteria bacterium]|nr:TerB family tellurite resistance protein [Candidatus Gracilibacteria bacterium]